MATMATPAIIARATGPDAHEPRDAARTAPTPAIRDAMFFSRLAAKVALVGSVLLAACLWFLHQRLGALADLRTMLLLFGAAWGSGAMLAFVGVRLIVARLVLMPAARLIQVAESAAAGDLTAPMPPAVKRGAIARLTRAIGSLLQTLKQLTGSVRTTASDISHAANAITGGGEHMATTAQHIADTSHDLSRRAAEMSTTIDALVADARRLVDIGNQLADGAHAGVARNTQLRQLARESGSRLDESALALDTLAADAYASAAAVEALASASEEIRAFVTLVTKFSRQSKLLALNAAMEAARAGEQGQGFAVVATEVRRLAAGAGEAAQRTEEVVKGVLERVAESRIASSRAANTVDGVRAATEQGLESFRQVEAAAEDATQWTSSIDQAATRSGALIAEMNAKLGALAEGTSRFAVAMQDVAAASQEQSASTQEIAAAGASLAASAQRLSALAAAFHTEAPAA